MVRKNRVDLAVGDGSGARRFAFLLPHVAQPGRAAAPEQPETRQHPIERGGRALPDGGLWLRDHGTVTQFGALSAPLTIRRNGTTVPGFNPAIG